VTRLRSVGELLRYSPANSRMMNEIVDYRCAHTEETLARLVRQVGAAQQALPPIDVSVVTYNSQRWISAFVESLLALRYPAALLTVRFVDNSSSDETVARLKLAVTRLRAAGMAADVILHPNKGFGAGHNAGLAGGTSPFCLVTNIDLEFEPDALALIVGSAQHDDARVAAWELRQRPFEHPKYYDPVTGLTAWNSHACVLLRRSAFQSVGGYDETIFMYGEDVELSYRLRRAGHLLRYCPQAAVQHHTYEKAGQIKPLQVTGSAFGNLYLRMKYGCWFDIAQIPLLAMARFVASSGCRRQLAAEYLRLLRVAPRALAARRATPVSFPFRALDYELSRVGSFVQSRAEGNEATPIVSVITRTFRGRGLYLQQALATVLQQTYAPIEHIVVEDGGDSLGRMVEELAAQTGRRILFLGLPKVGRSAAGNAGLKAAQGRYCLFLDDDDLLFAEHVETLVQALQDDPEAVAAYTPAMEVMTDASRIGEGRYAEVSHVMSRSLCCDFDYGLLKSRNCMAIQSVLFERRLFAERGGFDEKMDALEDWDLWLRYAWGHRFSYVPKVTSIFRTPADSQKRLDRQQALDRAYPFVVERARQFERGGSAIRPGA